MEVLTGIWQNIEAVTIGGISIIILTNALTQALKNLTRIPHEVMPYIVGVILVLLANGLGAGQILAGLCVGFLSAKIYDTFSK